MDEAKAGLPEHGGRPGTEAPAWQAAVERFGAMIRKVALERDLDDSEIDEIMQDVRVRLWRASRGRQDFAVTSSYVYQTAMSATLDMIRRRRVSAKRRKEPGAAGVSLGGTVGPDEQVMLTELEREVVQAVATLSEDTQAAVRMHLLGYPRREIGRLLGWSDGRTRNVLYRGLTKVRGILANRGFGPEVAG